MGWIIYISGFIVAYLMFKWMRNKADNNTWGDVRGTLFASIFSWGVIVFMICAIGVLFIWELIKAKNPPKWL